MNLSLTLTNDEEFPVDLRQLHAALESKQAISHWATARLSELIENEDFRVFDKTIKNPSGGRPRRDFHLTLDAAKAIALMERTETGKKVRRYFIECEKELVRRTAVQTLPDFGDPAQAARAWADQFEKRRLLESKVAEDAPKVHFHDTVAVVPGLMLLRDVSHTNPLFPGQNRFYARLREDGVIMPAPSTAPYQRYVDMGLFEVKLRVVDVAGYVGKQKIKPTTYVTTKGLAWLTRHYAKAPATV